MKIGRFFALVEAVMCLFVMAVFWELGLYVAENPTDRPWFFEWWVAVPLMQACGVLAFQFIRIWLDMRRLERDLNGDVWHTSHHLRGRIEKPFWGIVILATMLSTVACGHKTVTDPEGGEVRLTSALGFKIEATQEYLDDGGDVTQAHADLADRWWTSLMADLRRAKYPEAKTDPSKFVSYTYVWLYKPIGPDSSISCPGWTVLVGGCYDQFKPGFRVPGDYIDPDGWLGARPTAQPLKHEMTHHWCLKTMGHLCMDGDTHRFTMPNGRDIWEVQWYDAYPPAAAAAMAAATARKPCAILELQ